MIISYPLIKPKYYKSLVIDVINFIKYPKSKLSVEKSTTHKIYDTLGLFLIKILFSITVASLLGFVYEPENLTSTSMTERFTPLVLLLVGGVILPLFEEITFRLSLKYNPAYLALTFGTFTYYILTKAVFKSRLSLLDKTFWTRVIITLVVMLLMYAFIRTKKINFLIQNYWQKHFKVIFYTSCISFAWLHIFNFEINVINLLWLPVLTLPQLFSATIAGYTRVAFGFQYPLLLHMITNTLFLSLTFLPID